MIGSKKGRNVTAIKSAIWHFFMGMPLTMVNIWLTTHWQRLMPQTGSVVPPGHPVPDTGADVGKEWIC